MLRSVLAALASALSIDCWIPPSEEPVISTDLYTWSLMAGGDTRARRRMRPRAPGKGVRLITAVLPPLLEVYVVWHPDDAGGPVAEALIDHFHGTAFSGLVGGAVEVFVRSQGWLGRDDAPRPLPFAEPLPAAIAEAQLTVVVPLLGLGMAQAVQDGGAWRSYVEAIAASP